MSNTAREVVTRVTLDVGLNECQITVGVMQGDTARRIAVTLTAGGRPVALPAGTSAVFLAAFEGSTVGDGGEEVGICEPCVVDHRRGEIVLTLSEVMTAEARYMEGNVMIATLDGAVILSPCMGIRVTGNRFSAHVTQNESFDALAGLVGQFTVDKGEILREIEELHETYTEAEAPRVAAESRRAESELVRTVAEENRASAESERFRNESTRQVNESARIAAENARVAAENARESAEAKREADSAAAVKAASDATAATEATEERVRTALESGALKGDKGDKGDSGDAFRIVKTYPSVDAMNADYASADVKLGEMVSIDSDVEDEDNAVLYAKTVDGFRRITDMSGARGVRGERGDDGVTPEVGTNGNWYIGGVDTGVKAEGTNGTQTYFAERSNETAPEPSALGLTPQAFECAYAGQRNPQIGDLVIVTYGTANSCGQKVLVGIAQGGIIVTDEIKSIGSFLQLYFADGQRGERGSSGMLPLDPGNGNTVQTVRANTMLVMNLGNATGGVNLGDPIEGYDNEWGLTLTVGDPIAQIYIPTTHWGLGIAPTFASNTTTVIRWYYVGETLCGEWVTV